MAKKDYTGMSQRDFDKAQSLLGVSPVEAPNKRVAMSPMEKRGVNDIIGTEGARAPYSGGGRGQVGGVGKSRKMTGHRKLELRSDPNRKGVSWGMVDGEKPRKFYDSTHEGASAKAKKWLDSRVEKAKKAGENTQDRFYINQGDGYSQYYDPSDK